MASKSKKSTTDDKARFVYRGYVRCEFVASDKESVRSWIARRTPEECFTDVGVLAEDGYKVSIGRSNGGFSASLANVDGPEGSRGYMLAAHASEPIKALNAVLYKHFVLLRDGWDIVTPDDDDDLR